MMRGGSQPARRRTAVATADPDSQCCPYLHEAVELVGKRWTGAIVFVLLTERKPMRFSQIGEAVPRLSDRLLSERMKELEARGIVKRRVVAESPARVEYQLTEMGQALGPAMRELRKWARHWLD
jgi:DNA-binding HxlR family transcriptional regulator